MPEASARQEDETIETIEPVAQSGAGGAIGEYRLIAKLGSGGQADVFLALSQGPIKRLVVVKRLRSAYEFHEEYITMFLDEARLAARLAHPNVVHTYEVGRTDNAYFIAMEYLDGQPLERVMRAPNANKTFSHRMWAAIAAEVLAGLQYAHDLRDYDGAPLGIVHRDVSPHNIFLTYGGEVKLVDFGVAKAALNTVRTETGVLKGKITYMSPEQARGNMTDRRSDLFAMGIILWEAVTGKRLFVGEPLQILNRLLNDVDPVPRPTLTNPDVDPRLDEIVVRALQRSPEDRFQSAEEMRKALEAYIQSTGEPIEKSAIVAALLEMFGAEQAHVKEQILTHMSNVGSSSSGKLSSLTQAEPDLPELSSFLQSSISGSQPRGVHETRTATEPTARPRSRVGLVALALVAIVGGGVIAARMSARAKSTQITAQPSSPAAPAMATLSIASEPSGAMIRWNGRPVGQTPMRVELPVGPQTLIASKEGYDDEPLIVDLQKGGTVAERKLKLRPQAAAATASPSAAPAARAPSSRQQPRGGPASVAAAPTPSATTAATATSPASTSPRRVAPKDTW